MNENTARFSRINAKIISTLGPASRTPREIRALAEAGTSVFRLNFSHGSHEDHKAVFDIVRNTEKLIERPLAIMADLQGPKVRIGSLPSGEIKLKYQGEYTLKAGDESDDPDIIPVPHPEIIDVLEVDDVILVDDGKLIFTVLKIGKTPTVRADVPGKLTNRKGFTVRGKALPVRALTEKDRVDLEFALEIGVDLVALSFVQSVSDVSTTKAIIAGRAPLISKLEKPAATEELR